MSIINMQMMRYINLLDGTAHVKTHKCFLYNNMIVFAVPKKLMSKAIGPDAANIKKIQNKVGKRVRIVAEPSGEEDAERFVKDIVSPFKFKALEVKEGRFVLTAGGKQSKAMLMGRNKTRYEALNKILQDVFGMGLRIV